MMRKGERLPIAGCPKYADLRIWLYIVSAGPRVWLLRLRVDDQDGASRPKVRIRTVELTVA